MHVRVCVRAFMCVLDGEENRVFGSRCVCVHVLVCVHACVHACMCGCAFVLHALHFDNLYM